MAFTLRKHYPAYMGGEPFDHGELTVINPYTGERATTVPCADAAAVGRAIEMAHESRQAMAAVPAFKRAAVLRACVEQFKNRRAELAEACSTEAGKPINYAEGEVARLIDTFSIAADEALLAEAGETIPMAISQRAAGYRGMTKRVPIGPCAFITPFNFPLNLVAHKVAPAVAAGCPFVLKPADKTPVGALLIGEVLASAWSDAELPHGAWSILPASVDDAAALIEDDRIKLLSFTGSDKVGWELKAKAGKKKVVLELGGNAPCIIDETADLDDALDRIVTAAFAFAGQTCISVQRILVHERIYDEVRAQLIAAAKVSPQGDPSDRATVVGPMIRPEAARRLKEWIDEAVAAGGALLCGGEISGPCANIISAAVLEHVPTEAKLVREEAFGPVIVLSRFRHFDAALEEANSTRFGLQVGLFTNRLDRAVLAWDRLEYGGIIVNDTSSFRVDHMPYGGVKDSGIGREGLRYAIEDMTETRLLVIRQA